MKPFVAGAGKDARRRGADPALPRFAFLPSRESAALSWARMPRSRRKPWPQLACQRLRGIAGARVLISGLGFGFTTSSGSGLVAKDALNVHAEELLPGWSPWNHEHL